MNRLAVGVLLLATIAFSACGDDDGGDKPSAEQPTPQSEPAPQTTTESQASEEEECGSISGGPGGGDSVENITATGVDCTTAKAIARAVTIEGADAPPSGFDCPDAQTYAAEQQTCTKGDAKVSWDVKFE